MKNDRKDDRKDDTDERRKGNGSRERKTVSVDGRLLRPCVLVRFLSIRRLTAAERDLHTKNGSAREWSRRMMRESGEERARERKRDSHDEKGGTGENWKALRRMARLCGCRAREIERKREKEGRMDRERDRGREKTEVATPVE